jgi:hypothetical protein
MRVRRGIAAIILGVVIAAIGFAVTSSQELRRPNKVGDKSWRSAGR